VVARLLSPSVGRTVEVWMPKREPGKEWLAQSPVQVTAKNAKGQEFRGLVTPLT
jgi:hypothetical protein